LPQTPRLRPHAHDGADGLAIACLARADGARCAVKGTTGERSGHDVVFATLLDADPRLPARTLDAVSGVLTLLRRRQGPPALVAQAIAEITEDLDGPVTGAHVEIAPQSGWIAVAPLGGAVVIASTSPAQGEPTPPTEGTHGGERVHLAGTDPAAVLVVALDLHTDAATTRSITEIADDVLRREPPAGAAEVLERFAEAIHTSETTPCVRGALAVSLDRRPDLTGRARRLPAQPVATQLGRRFAVAALPDDADAEVAESVELITDELVANALRHAHDDVIVSVVDESTGTRIAVSDDDDRMPDRAAPRPDSESGRGLIVIEALADEVGTTEREVGGKWVWARLHWRRPHR
jgi:anti-sigma regulatory factor (Ser/Thr protein kinase)